MTLPQQKFREVVFQLLYSHDMGHGSEEEMIPLLMAELAITKKTVRTAQERVQTIIAQQQSIDDLISKASLSYAFERIPSVERNILRLGVFEMLYDQTIPPKVAIAEAMRLARKFSTPESASFINAIMDNLYKSSRGEEVDVDTFTSTVALMTKSESIAHEASLHSEVPPEGESDDNAISTE